METKNFNQTMSNEPTSNEKVMLPRPRMGFKEAVSTCFVKYATFKGRARRSEYWWFSLFATIVMLVCFVPFFVTVGFKSDDAFSSEWTLGTCISAVLVLIGALFVLVVIIPSFAVQVRRLHDTGRSGWWVSWSVIASFVVTIITIILFGADKGADMGEILAISSAFKVGIGAGLVMLLATLAEWGVGITIFIFSLLDSHKGENKYGASPKYA